jgi:hypothetical protein
MDDGRGVASQLCELGSAELARGRPLQAQGYFAKAWETVVKTGMAGMVGQASPLIGLGNVALAVHDPERAREYYRQALSTPGRDVGLAASALRGLAGALLLEGRPEPAARILALVIYSAVTPQPVRSAAEATFRETGRELSPEQLAGAVQWARGRSMDEAAKELAANEPAPEIPITRITG